MEFSGSTFSFIFTYKIEIVSQHMTNWRNIAYLLEGNPKQQLSFEVLSELNIFNTLKNYNPILTGTIPINIDIDNSDLDIICQAHSPESIKSDVRKYYQKYPQFKDRIESEIYIANFKYKNIDIEIYSASQPTSEQNAYIHMLIEYRILKIAGEEFRKKILELKKNGYKTEPAFGILLSLKKPFEELIDMSKLTDAELQLFIQENWNNKK